MWPLKILFALCTRAPIRSPTRIVRARRMSSTQATSALSSNLCSQARDMQRSSSPPYGGLFELDSDSRASQTDGRWYTVGRPGAKVPPDLDVLRIIRHDPDTDATVHILTSSQFVWEHMEGWFG
jgi:hypothetical protein